MKGDTYGDGTFYRIACLPGRMSGCAANFSFAQLAKRKSLGRSKPATNSQAQAPQHTVWNISTLSILYYIQEFTVPRVLLWLTFFTPTEMLPVERVVAD